VIASILIVLTAPVMLAVAAAVRFTSPGPVIFRQKRYGLDGKEIVVYKFRSMTVTEDGQKTYKQVTRNDSRVTPVGAFIRATSLDELPQLFNVLEGSMSIVGPRPHAIAVNEQYRRLIPGYMVRHKVKPGITGWAQVNGYRGGDDIDSMRRRIELDLEYLQHWSLTLDLMIILRTALIFWKDRMPTESIHPLRFLALLLVASSLLGGLHAYANGNVDYRIGPGDLLRVSIFGSPELSHEVRVSDSGFISYPLIGTLHVADRSTTQVESMLKASFMEGGYLRDPQVLVHVVEYQSQKVAVLGHVMKPGQYALQSKSRVLDMLAAAGGVRYEEAGDTAVLIRRDGSREPVDLHALFDGDPTHNLEVQGGDTLYVARAPQFYIYGEVQRPGVYRLERGMTVSRAISAGGGLTPRGSERRVVVKRKLPTGEERQLALRADDPLQPDDVLVVKEGLF